MGLSFAVALVAFLLFIFTVPLDTSRKDKGERMEIGNRLCELRRAKGLTQDALGKRAGLTPIRISRVENGHVTPSLAVLVRWAKALDVELYQLFFVEDGKPEARKLPEHIPVQAQERSLLGLFRQMGSEDRSLLVSLAREMVRHMGNRE